ncbi:MAG TPA: S41 family peptidase [Polyangia bacterium]|nr:S41 family peptidase [Polyangia bacterium]
MRWAARCATSLLLVLHGFAAEAQLDEVARAADLRQLQQALVQRWAYADDKRQTFGLDLDALFAAALKENHTLSTPLEFAGLLLRLTAQLHDGHSGVDGPALPLPALPTRRWPFTLRDSSDGVLVEPLDAVDRDAAKLSSLRGLRLLRVDGVALETRLADVATRLPASTEASRRKRALAAVTVSARPHHVFVLADAAGRERELTLATLPYAPVTTPNVQWRRLPRNVGYLKVRSMLAGPNLAAWLHAAPAQQQLWATAAGADVRTAFAELGHTQALVLDLRGNAGGTDLVGKQVASQLLPAGFVYYRLSALLPDGRWSPPLPSVLPAAAAPANVYQRPVVVLVDEDTFSAADNLAACLRDNRPDIRFVGRPTGAGSGAPRPVQLEHSGVRVYFTTMRVFSPHGYLIESHGVIPDVEVQWSRADLLANRDPDLDAALRLLAPRLR